MVDGAVRAGASGNGVSTRCMTVINPRYHTTAARPMIRMPQTVPADQAGATFLLQAATAAEMVCTGAMTRAGLLLLITACATAPKPAPPPPSPPAPPSRDVSELVTLEGDKIVVRESISFEHGKSEVTPACTDMLDAVAKILRENDAIRRLTIVGHADATGDPANNPPLSLARAIAVKKYLESRGIDAARLEAEGIGAEKPIDSNETDEGRARNRRVEFRISR